MSFTEPTMPRSTAYLEAEFHTRRAELIAHERLTAEAARLEAVRKFVAEHSPGEDAWVDDSVMPPVVRWTGYAVNPETNLGEPFQCAASNFREARQELGY